MKRLVTVSLIFSLVISLAAPSGAVFAVEGETDVVSVSDETAVLIDDGVEDLPRNNEEVKSKEEMEASEEAIEDATDSSVRIDDLVNLQEIDNEIDRPDKSDNMNESNNDTTAIGPSGGVVISRVLTTGGSRRTSEELVEIYNNSENEIDVSDWCVYSYKINDMLTIGCIASPSIGARVILPAQTAYVFASTSFASANKDLSGIDFVPDRLFGVNGSSYINNDDGRIVLQDAGGAVHDAVTWAKTDSSTQLPIDQGDTRAVIDASYALERNFDKQTGYYRDTNDNKTDFLTGVVRSTYKTGNTIEKFDACLNITGWQTVVPEGLYRDQLTGNCTDTLPNVNLCKGVVISEIAANVGEQFIEIHNTTNQAIDLSGCQLQTNRNKKTYVFSEGIAIDTNRFIAIRVEDSGLTLTKTTEGTVYLVSSDGLNEVDSQSYKNLAQNSSWSLVEGAWLQTYKLTPGEANVYEKYLPCEEGYWRNEETGRCNKDAEVSALVDCGEGRERNQVSGRCRNIPMEKEYAPCKDDQYRSEETNRCRSIAVAGSTLKPCKEGQYRSEETNRCRSIASAVASVLKPCADDQFRNPETNRCKKIASADELTDCGEGRERNPATNRCRNIVASVAPAIGFSPEKVQQVAGATWGWWVFGGVSMLALGYAGWQWRWELKQLAIRARSVFARSDK